MFIISSFSAEKNYFSSAGVTYTDHSKSHPSQAGTDTLLSLDCKWHHSDIDMAEHIADHSGLHHSLKITERCTNFTFVSHSEQKGVPILHLHLSLNRTKRCTNFICASQTKI